MSVLVDASRVAPRRGVLTGVSAAACVASAMNVLIDMGVVLSHRLPSMLAALIDAFCNLRVAGQRQPREPTAARVRTQP